MKNISELLEDEKSCISCMSCEEDDDNLLTAVYLCSKMCRDDFGLEEAVTSYCAEYRPWTCGGHCDSYKKSTCIHIGAPGCIVE